MQGYEKGAKRNKKGTVVNVEQGGKFRRISLYKQKITAGSRCPLHLLSFSLSGNHGRNHLLKWIIGHFQALLLLALSRL